MAPKYILAAGVGNKKGGDCVDLISDALVQAPNGLDAKQEHRCLGDNFLAQESVFYWSDALGTLDDISNRPVGDIEGVNNPPD